MENLIQKTTQTLGAPEILVQFVFSIAILLIAGVLLRVGFSLITRLADRNPSLSKSARLRTFHSLLYSALRVIIFFFAITAILGVFRINTASLLAAAGIGGIAIAMGAKNVVSDVIAGGLMILDNSLNVGDYVMLDSKISGEVKEMRIRQVVIHGYTGMDYIIPNAQVKIVANYGHGPLQADIAVSVPYRISVKEARGIVERVRTRALAMEPTWFSTAPYFIGIDRADAFTYTMTIGSRVGLDAFWAAPRLLRQITIEELDEMGAYRENSSAGGRMIEEIEQEKGNAHA